MCSHVTDFLTDTEAVLHHLVRAIFLGIATFQIETSPSSSRSKGEAWELQGGKQRVTCLEEQKLERFWRAPSQQYQTEVNNCLGGKGLPAEPQRKCAACRLEGELQVLCCNLCWGLLVVQLFLLFGVIPAPRKQPLIYTPVSNPSKTSVLCQDQQVCNCCFGLGWVPFLDK